ncbi:hypothetical protein DIPPA_02664 [Diplonema papillatum]|nr:hypothetical protein DIPPA_00762 [Diplonema papillatum]KAJ9447992.1 hypothetical protein DIPPA_02664 [Diplonema papillatum]
MSATFGALGLDNAPLRSLASALRNAGAAVPLRQAKPMEKDTLLKWARQQQPDVMLAALLAWKTASRWAEVAALAASQFLLISPAEIIVDWMQTPKGRRADPFKASRFTVVKGPLTAEIATLLQSLIPFNNLTTISTTKLDELWGRSNLMRGYTAHSVKRGAMTRIFQLMGRGVPIPPHLVERLAKHKEQGGPGALSGVTVRYGADPVAMARALETGKVTIHLLSTSKSLFSRWDNL